MLTSLCARDNPKLQGYLQFKDRNSRLGMIQFVFQVCCLVKEWISEQKSKAVTNTQEIPEKKVELQHFPQTLEYKASNVLQSYRSNSGKSGQELTGNF